MSIQRPRQMAIAFPGSMSPACKLGRASGLSNKSGNQGQDISGLTSFKHKTSGGGMVTLIHQTGLASPFLDT